MRMLSTRKAAFFSFAAGSFLLMNAFSPSQVVASTEIDELKKKITDMQETIDEMDDRLNEAELHTSTDKVSFGVEMRTKADSIHYDNMQFAPQSMIQGFFTPFTFVGDPFGGFQGATLQQATDMMDMMKTFGMVPPTESYDFDNGNIWTSKFHLNMKSKVNNNLSFAGRLAAYKVWGDSSGVKFNSGSLGDVTFDGNTTSLPHGDTMRLERAYFNYKNQAGSVPFNLSFGRRPSTDGPPREYGNYSLEGGSPIATIINWQFDGASLSFGLEELATIPGFAFKLCYGVGFEGDWGNSYSINATADVDDVHLMGFIWSLFDDDTHKVEMNYAHASDITDGFTGLTVMPFIVSKSDHDGNPATDDIYTFTQNAGGFISRMQPMTNIGDWDALTMLFRTNVADFDMFLSGSWSHTEPEHISTNPFYELMGQGLLNSNGDMEKRDGYMILVGAVIPMPLEAKLGLEYNWGSKYWFNFTGAEDSLIGSKMAVRGQVYEGYYIQPIYGDTFFLKAAYQYYDYEYTGSGNPMGEPVKIDEATGLDALFPIVDKAWTANLSATLRF
ncbi:MAG: DUF3373 domain-containing protein [Proteobacteria bacterium]|nr:DUF3373 domain-containing protein [Pseudomonadota bacterium]MBU1710287.1 DUF3373 domain-containing protein [Pseudomonadota bacterium]